MLNGCVHFCRVQSIKLHENPISPDAPSVKLPHLSFHNQYSDQVRVYQDNLMPEEIRSELRELLHKYHSFTRSRKKGKFHLSVVVSAKLRPTNEGG